MNKIVYSVVAVLTIFSPNLRADEPLNITHVSPGNASHLNADRHSSTDQKAGPKFCAAVRGNGQWIFAHFASLARLTESYGTLDMIAGGSSGSITAFLYESMLMNDAVKNCKGGRLCTPEEKARRVALLLKSTEEYLEVLKQSKEGKALLAAAEIAAKIKKEIEAKNIPALIEKGLMQKAQKALKDILEQKEFVSLINPDLFKLVSLGRTQEVIDEITNFGDFKADSKSIFFRPGLIDFGKAPEFFGKLADFYAGKGISNQAGMEDFLNDCAVESNVGRLWEDMKKDPKTSGCTKRFNELARVYRENFEADGNISQRIKDPIGMKLPALISTSVIDSPKLVQEWHAKMDDYWKNPNTDFKFDVTFDKVKFGYWGRPQDLKTIKSKFRDTNDAKSKKFLGLGPAGTRGVGRTNWEEALRTSPAEPGLAAIQPIDENRLSVGGWSDLHPTLVLKALGCQNIVYVTREGDESDFAMGVAKLLGMGDKEKRDLYQLGAEDGLPVSSYQRSINMADAVWCTDWNHDTYLRNGELIRHSYLSTLVTDSPFFEKPMAGNPTLTKIKEAPGCAKTK